MSLMVCLLETFRTLSKIFVANEDAYSFMSSVKGSAAYWKNMLSDVLAMVKQLGIPSFFFTLSCADLQWDELMTIISKLKGCKFPKMKLIICLTLTGVIY